MVNDEISDAELALIRSEYFFVQWLVCDGEGEVLPDGRLFEKKNPVAAEQLRKLFGRKTQAA